ncbi:MAG: hypothetical protein JST50_06870 [Bacteroidetes bacterium]|nr:hypothetical protein [Bacteroidota bacterium]
MKNTFIILQVGYSQPMTLGEYLLIATLIAIVLFFITRELFLWYWKVNEMVSNQQKQIKLSEEQNKLLRQLTGSPDIDD